ncbi:biopolymer transport protein ExbD [Posidoniimonas corsicana]|uniref:Biopolymer transport protein ExbD n=1 Tax=Posidoniimonas corsicana TaxID=1938618 RepID=A0A5C5VDL0_9BACT|nr:biopolymer transporter ExbD [Posidoniimonas corsicana]TWT36083.1 biopolymer transport protein ExbD [Posidoniimonas corsicana]
MRFKQRKQLDASEGDLTPMIDMTFQLIAFFMVLINFTEVEQDQRITLPASELAQPPDVPYDEPLTVQITKDETILFARDELEPDALLPALRREASIIRAYDKQLSDVTIIIRADETVRTGVVQDAISACQEAEFETFALRGKTSSEDTLILRE